MTKYKKEYIEIVKQELSEGASLKELAGMLGVNVSTISRWREEYKDFDEAVDMGLELSEAWWLGKGRKELYNKDFNHVLYYMNMKNRFKWSDRTETNGTLNGKMTFEVKIDT